MCNILIEIKFYMNRMQYRFVSFPHLFLSQYYSISMELIWMVSSFGKIAELQYCIIWMAEGIWEDAESFCPDLRQNHPNR